MTMSSRPALSIVDHWQSTDEDVAPQAQGTRATRTDQTLCEIVFGSFCLLPTQFLLLEGGEPVRLGSRALEILVALLERPGEWVTKQELMVRVWPNVFVHPANLTVHVSALRRALRDGRDGNRFIINMPGRGYRFVAPIQVSMREKARSGFFTGERNALEGTARSITASSLEQPSRCVLGR
jgi:DNA-binding winged helix-turn-helix (wHTH) protein